ncbi:MAG: hypothetical protein DBX59_02095 [Bacillota bacterium]|nr:MAG: hypothetical protein DBX59_02095 [Bacillota bacterium]
MAATKTAIDLGTSDTKIYTLGGGIVLNEPSVVALDTAGGRIKAIGSEAKKLIGKTAENTKTVFPVFEGEVVNEKLAASLLGGFLNKVGYRQGFSSSAVVSVPCGADLPLLKKLEKTLDGAGIDRASFIETPIAAAIGSGIPLSEYSPCFVIDMGGGVTDIAALSLDGIIAGVSVGLGGKNTDVSLIDFIADAYNLQIGLQTAERVKLQIGSLYENDTLSTVVNGRDLSDGRPRSVELRARDVLAPVKKYYDKIFEIAGTVLSKLPPEVSAEIRHKGVYVSGGSAALAGLESYYKAKFNMNVIIAENPAMCAVSGLGSLLGTPDLAEKLAINAD